MSFLLIDVGNTRVKLGCHDGQQWIHRTYADLAAGISLPSTFAPKTVLVSNVAGDAAGAALREALPDLQAQFQFFSATQACAGLRNEYENPSQLGPDRWAAAIGAWHLVKGECLVVNAGTATTLDVLIAPAAFAGGCILPGLDMMAGALKAGTAGLGAAMGQYRDVPRNTRDAIYSGCVNAHLGAIERMLSRLPPHSPIVLAGGAANALLPLLQTRTVHQAPWLVLDGLLIAARELC